MDKNSKIIPLFPEEELMDVRGAAFQGTELGQLHATIPWNDLAALLPVPKSSNGCGAKPWFNNAGKFACMFLKHYTGLSDKKLIQRINTDWAMQEFCGIRLGINEQIKDVDIIGRIRGQLSADLEKLPEAQKVLADEWFKYIEQEELHQVSGDASCYESYLRYPTDVKLLWECAWWLYEKQLFRICSELKVNRPRNKFKEQSRKQLAYSKKKRKKPSQTKVRLRALLYLVGKGKHQLEELLKEPQAAEHFSVKDLFTYQIVSKVLDQQQYMFDNNVRSVENRIVSIFKHYVRPIVRGKENKAVEFGMKTHKIQIAGISFVEYTSFDAYNESTRMKSTLALHEELTGVKCMRAAFDQLYATNANRKLLTQEQIMTNFSRKGKASTKQNEVARKQEQIIKQQLGKDRATVLEGSFGNEKNHYGLRKIKARSAETEQVWLFFGMMTANAVKVMRLKNKKEKEQLKKAS